MYALSTKNTLLKEHISSVVLSKRIGKIGYNRIGKNVQIGYEKMFFIWQEVGITFFIFNLNTS